MNLPGVSSLSVPNIFAVEPHAKPIYRLDVDGKDITASLDGRLISLTLTDNKGFEADQLEIQLDDTDGKLDLPPRGAEIKLSLGFEDSGLVDKGTYTVDEVEHSGTPDVLSIRARSADLRGGLSTQRERSWHEVKLGDIVRTIADENDLEAQIPDALASKIIDHIDQTNESSINLLSRLAKQFDAFTTVKNGKLLFMNSSGGISASGKPLPTVKIERHVGDQHHFSIADRETYTGVRATYNDTHKAIKGEVTWGKTEDSAEKGKAPAPAPPTTGQFKHLEKAHKSRAAAQKAARKEWQRLKGNKAARGAFIGVTAKYKDVNLNVSGEVSYGQADDEKKQKSAQRLAAKDSAKKAASQPSSALGHSADNVKTLRHVYASKENALRAARAEWRRLQRGMATFSITLARARPELFPELPASVSGWKPAIDNTDWILTKVIHNFTDAGYKMPLELEIRATEIPD